MNRIYHRSSLKLALSRFGVANCRSFATSITVQQQAAHTELQFLTDKYSTFSFRQIKSLSRTLSNELLAKYNTNDLKGERIAVLCNNNYTYLVSIMGIWMANGIPLGLNKQYPSNLIEYFVNDANCRLVINGNDKHAEADGKHSELDDVLKKNNVINYRLDEGAFHLCKDDCNVDKSFSPREELKSLNEMRMLMKEQGQKDALILYTSGTTGKPKGVVLNFDNITNLASTLIETWQFTAQDCLLHVLPLNHVHGLLYGLMTSFYNGNQVYMLPKFDADVVWSMLLDESNDVNMLLGVPTVYVQLVNTYLKSKHLQDKYPVDSVKEIFKRKMRLLACGSAPLNVKTYKQWTDITGYKLLDRYGMTEIGLGLSNPFDEDKRIPGTVGRPYGPTQVRIVEQSSNDKQDKDERVLVVSDQWTDNFPNECERIIGELQVKGEMVFNRYHDKPAQTNESFTRDGWFKTGDTAEFLRDLKCYKLVGRTSVDVIKSGGYKISALDIERELLAHPSIDDVAIMGLNDPVWGQKIFALLVLKPTETPFDQAEFIDWCKKRLPKHSVPRLVKIIDKMPRNLLGKVNKKELIKIYEKEFSQSS